MRTKRPKAKANIEVQFGNTLKIAREMQGLSQRELARRAKIHSTWLGTMERIGGNPTLLVIDRLAEALDISPWLLLVKSKFSK